jgi:hypothetical protein
MFFFYPNMFVLVFALIIMMKLTCIGFIFLRISVSFAYSLVNQNQSSMKYIVVSTDEYIYIDVYFIILIKKKKRLNGFDE